MPVSCPLMTPTLIRKVVDVGVDRLTWLEIRWRWFGKRMTRRSSVGISLIRCYIVGGSVVSFCLIEEGMSSVVSFCFLSFSCLSRLEDWWKVEMMKSLTSKHRQPDMFSIVVVTWIVVNSFFGFFFFCLFFDYSLSGGLVSRDLIGVMIILPTIGIPLPGGSSYVLFCPMSVGVGLRGDDAQK